MSLVSNPGVSRMVIWETDRFLASLGFLKGEPLMDVSAFRGTEWVAEWDWREAGVDSDYLDKRDRESFQKAPATKPAQRPGAAAAEEGK